IAQGAEGFCYEPLLGDFSATMQVYIATHGETLDGYTRTQPNFMAVPLVKTFLDKDSQPLQVKVTTPIIIYQGLADSTVPKLATDLLISNATTVGTKINSYVTGNWDHGTAMSSNVDNIVADVKTLMLPQ
ncbi:MAG: alpha/beta hydrolase, partial [Acinetobacter baumannii]|nr:alpha/beta hydrolase [Acinetobacter baumannii]